jgi:hypothetical protein
VAGVSVGQDDAHPQSGVDTTIGTVAALLPAAAILLMGETVARVAISDAAWRDRLAFGAGGIADFAIVALALGASLVLLLMPRPLRWERWTRIASAVIAVAVICAAAYLIWYLLTLRVDNSNINIPGRYVNFFGLEYRRWAVRTGVIATSSAMIVLGIATLVALARQRSATNERLLLRSEDSDA